MHEVGGVRFVSETLDWLVFETDVDDREPAWVLRWFTDAALLNSWWGDEAIIEPRPGGSYHVHWRSSNLTMHGTVASVTDTSLAFSWSWEHEPEAPARAVVITALPADAGTRLVLAHGPFNPVPDVARREVAERQDLIDGWFTFLPELRAKIAATD